MAFMGLALPLLLAMKYHPHNPIWSRPSARPVLLLLFVNAAIFLILPAVMVFRLSRRKRKFGSYIPAGEDLKKYRSRVHGPQPLWRRVLFPAFELVSAITATIAAAHRSHRSTWEWGLAWILWLSVAFSAPAAIAALLGFGKLGQREGFTCPGCGSAPPSGSKWKCKQCGKRFDTFLARAVCPHCGFQHPTTMCGRCEAVNPMNDWIYAYTARNCGPARG
jgi:transcription elongation factor Elf1